MAPPGVRLGARGGGKPGAGACSWGGRGEFGQLILGVTRC